MNIDPVVNLELKVLVDQIRSLNQSIRELDSVIKAEGSKHEEHKILTSIKGIGDQVLRKITVRFVSRQES